MRFDRMIESLSQSQDEEKQEPRQSEQGLEKQAEDHPDLLPLIQSIERSSTKFDTLFQKESNFLQYEEDEFEDIPE